MAFVQSRLNDYDSLESAITSWLSRVPDDEDTVLQRIPDFIRLCESRINKELRGQVNQRRSWAYINEAVEGLPIDFVAPSHVSYVDVSGRSYSLPPVSVKELRNRYSYPGQPCVYAIAGPQIMFGPYVEYALENTDPSQLARFEIVYFAEVPPLTNADVTTNDVLIQYPDLYLFGSLVEAQAYITADQLAMWEQRFQQTLTSANKAGMDAILGGTVCAPPENVV
jgi:hypothetical protein